jgi:hypothetical protein
MVESESNIDQWNNTGTSVGQKTAIIAKEKQKKENDLALPIKYVASKNSKVFHRSGCPYAQKIGSSQKCVSIS